LIGSSVLHFIANQSILNALVVVAHMLLHPIRLPSQQTIRPLLNCTQCSLMFPIVIAHNVWTTSFMTLHQPVTSRYPTLNRPNH
jgi:hypothetical protein